MKSITQIQHELDGQTLISNFFRLIGEKEQSLFTQTS